MLAIEIHNLDEEWLFFEFSFREMVIKIVYLIKLGIGDVQQINLWNTK